jgi:hypothetical protein
LNGYYRRHKDIFCCIAGGDGIAALGTARVDAADHGGSKDEGINAIREWEYGASN